MFGNRIAYTSSPGGQRRGLIWQSGQGGGVTDPRNYLFDYGLTGGTTHLPPARYINSDIWNGNGSPTFWQWVPPQRSDYAITCPYYIYTTQWTTDEHGEAIPMIISSEYSRRIEIDAIFEPDEKDLTPAYYNNDPDKPDYQQLYAENSGRFKYYEGMTGFLDGYGKEIGAQASCPFRIKGQFIYSDYYYDIYAAAGGSYVQLDPEAIFNYFEGLLANIPYPDHNDFRGSSARGLSSTMYTLPWPTLQLDNNTFTRQLVDSSGNPYISNVQYAWTKSARILYQGLNQHYCMYISPALYPATGISDDCDRYNWNYSHPNADMLQHNVPGFDEVRIKMPFVAGNPLLYSDQQYHPNYRAYDYMSNQGFTTPGSTPTMGSNALSRIYSNAAPGILRGSGIEDVTPPNNYATEITLRDVNYMSWLWGQIQPGIGFRQQYLVDVSPAVASFRTRQPTVDDIRCGRFKYIGFKGTISFFETYT